MAFQKKTWTDRMVEYAGRRKLTNINTKQAVVYDVERAEGAVSKEGDAFSSQNMNDLEQRVADGFSAVEQTTTKLNRDLAKGQIQFDIQNGKGFYKAVGADTWTPFKTGVTLLGRYSAVSTYDLSNVPGYESLNVDDFLCVTNTGNTNGSKYENDSNGTIQLSIGYTAAQLSYNASTGILTITPALLSGSAFHNPATATASGYLSTSVYLIQ